MLPEWALTFKCPHCKGVGLIYPAPVSCLVVFAPALSRPYVMPADEDYWICHGVTGKCRAIFELINKATVGHPATKDAGQWTRVIVVFQDGAGFDVRSGSQTVGALA